LGLKKKRHFFLPIHFVLLEKYCPDKPITLSYIHILKAKKEKEK